MKTRVIDALNNATTTHYDEWGRVVKVNAAINPDVEYFYNAVDRLTQVTRGGANTLLPYDYAGRKLTMDNPDMGDWGYEYEPVGNLKKQTDARGCVSNLGYDVLNRLTSKAYSGACEETLDVTYTYDQGEDAIGLRTGMSDASGSTSWAYDDRGRVTSETVNVDDVGSFVTQWGYNSADAVTWMKYPGGNAGQVGEQVNYTYNNQGLLESAINASQTYTYVLSTAYDVAGRVVERALGDDGNQVVVGYDYFPWDENVGRLDILTSGVFSDTDSLQKLEYDYDAIGNVKTIKDYKVGSLQTLTFAYDNIYRLTSSQASGGLYGNFTQESYTYNGTTGNLASKAGVTYVYTDSNHAHAVTGLSNGNSYEYDANGNMTLRDLGAGEVYTLTYDAENHMIDVNGAVTSTFLYGGDGQRVMSTEGVTTKVYIGNYFEWQFTSEPIQGR